MKERREAEEVNKKMKNPLHRTRVDSAIGTRERLLRSIPDIPLYVHARLLVRERVYTHAGV